MPASSASSVVSSRYPLVPECITTTRYDRTPPVDHLPRRYDRNDLDMTLTVGALWRYPVKTLAGERLDTAEITPNGIVGDRVVHVRGPEGVRTSRRHHNLLGLHATLGPDGEPLV